MKVDIKNKAELARMREACRMSAEIRDICASHVAPGVTTGEIDDLVADYCRRFGVKASFFGYGGFPGHLCVSINDEVIHGIPSDERVLREGDIVKIDVGACYRGYHGDSARTYPVGKISEEAAKLIAVTRESFYAGMAAARVGNRIGDVGHAVESLVTSHGFSVVRRYVGHGVGRAVHEEPDVPNYGTPGRGVRLCEGLVIAIEPMVNAGTFEVRELPDGWTVKTVDHRLSAHYENTVALTSDGVINLTEVEKDD